jgi:hypothetical protein
LTLVNHDADSDVPAYAAFALAERGVSVTDVHQEAWDGLPSSAIQTATVGHSSSFLSASRHTPGACSETAAAKRFCEYESDIVDNEVTDAHSHIRARGHAPELLAETAWLTDRLADPSIRDVDARRREQYQAGHMSGAVHMDGFGNNIPRAENGDMGSAAEFARIVGGLGISNATRVVVYEELSN